MNTLNVSSPTWNELNNNNKNSNNKNSKSMFSTKRIPFCGTFVVFHGVLYKVNPDLHKKRTLYQNLKTQFRQIGGCWFQIWQWFFKIPAQIYSKKAFLIPNLGIFILARNFANSQIWGCWFQVSQYYFQVPALNYPNKVILVSNLRIFIFAPNFAVRQIRGHWLQIWQ